MIDRFTESLNSNISKRNVNKILLGISGGIDSMVMADLFLQTDYKIAVAHCNFQLRGNESEKDEEFVRDYARKNKLSFFTTRFDTNSYAEINNLSIQMAARDLRYNWFHAVLKEHGYDLIAVAHNRDDIIETFLLNLTRGTGIKGLTGIKPLKDGILRPLLFASRAEIETYSKNRKLLYREDSSNKEIKYKRNLIRHQIIPLFEKLNPSFRKTVIQETNIFSATCDIYKKELELLMKAVKHEENPVKLSISKIRSLKISIPVFFDMLQPYGFSYSTVEDIYQSFDKEPGKEFRSEKYILLKNRNELIIEKQADLNFPFIVQIHKEMKSIDQPVSLQFEIKNNDIHFTIPDSPDRAALDLDKLSFPLTLRNWQEGDYFYPLGMDRKKKVSDFLIDQKIDRLSKKRIGILTSKNDIVWIAGHRIDNRFKITDETKKVFLVSLKD